MPLRYMKEAGQLWLLHEWGGPRCVKLDKKALIRGGATLVLSRLSLQI